MTGARKVTVKSLSEVVDKIKDEVKIIMVLKQRVEELEKQKVKESVLKKRVEELEKKIADIENKEFKEKDQNDKSFKTGFECKKCDKSLDSRRELKIHQQEYHPRVIICKECDHAFPCSIDFEIHMKKVHADKEKENYQCNKCEKTFVVNWRLAKHLDMHNDQNAQNVRKCHFFNNNKHCPYEEIGCMYQHQESPQCIFQERCRNRMCQFKHLRKNKCSECEYIPISNQDLDDHTQEKHGENEVNQEKEDIFHEREDILNDSVERTESEVSTDEEHFPCETCDKVYDDIEDLIEHYGETGHMV